MSCVIVSFTNGILLSDCGVQSLVLAIGRVVWDFHRTLLANKFIRYNQFSVLEVLLDSKRWPFWDCFSLLLGDFIKIAFIYFTELSFYTTSQLPLNSSCLSLHHHYLPSLFLPNLPVLVLQSSSCSPPIKSVLSSSPKDIYTFLHITSSMSNICGSTNCNYANT